MKKIIEKKRTVLNTSLSYFDAAWARAREIRLHPDTTIAIKKEVKLLFQFLFKRREQDRQRLGNKKKNSLHFLFLFFLARFNLLLQKKKKNSLLFYTHKQQLLNQYDCVTTPAEFIAAFKANTPRCVSEDLVGRLSSGVSVEQAANRSVSRSFLVFFSFFMFLFSVFSV